MNKIIGYCRFCNQSRILKNVPEDLDEYPGDPQDVLNDLASKECDCEKARHHRKLAADWETASHYIDDLVDKKEVAEALREFITPLQEHKAVSIAVKIDDKTKITLSISQDGALSLQRVDTQKTQYDTE